MTTTAGTTAVAPKAVPDLPADLDAGLRRLKLATVRRTAPEVLLTAKTQRWTPEEVLRTLVEAEIAARDASNTANRLKAAAFPVIKTLDGFDVSASSIPQATVDYLASLEWIRAQHNLAIIGPPGTGKSHVLIGLGHAAVHAGHKVRYFTAADLVDTLYRGLADNTVGKIIDTLLRADLVIIDEVGFAPLDDTACPRKMIDVKPHGWSCRAVGSSLRTNRCRYRLGCTLTSTGRGLRAPRPTPTRRPAPAVRRGSRDDRFPDERDQLRQLLDPRRIPARRSLGPQRPLHRPRPWSRSSGRV
jgi:IstB-like ATP binding protein